MPGSRLNVHLYRDSFNTPWGFRLQGGKDLNQPLIVQRVFSNSPAEGELQRGDVILSINSRDSAQLTHKQAQDFIKHGGGQVQLVVNRPPPGTHVAPLSPPIVTQRPRAPSLQQPPSMPGGGVYGHMPTKVNLTKLGGGGPEFGSDFANKGYGQTPAQRVHTSLDNITLSPRTPEVQTSSPFYQPYEPPQPVAQQAYQAPPPPQQVYTPTGLLLEQQRLQEQQQDEGEAIVPVWERRKQFQQGPGQSSAVRTPANKPPPRVPKPRPGPSSYADFGTDYSKGPGQKQSSATWRPAPQFKPTPAPVSAPVATYSPTAVQYAPRPGPKPGPPPAPKPSPPAPSNAFVPTGQPAWQRGDEPDSSGPAWRSTLKSTGVKPWEMDTTNYAIEQQPVRSVPYVPSPAKSPIPSAPFSPTQTGTVDMGGADNGPKVVHLQYNSPMHLYSNQNVNETLQGQTQALSGQTKGKMAPAVAPKPQYSPVQPVQHNQPFYEEIGASDF